RLRVHAWSHGRPSGGVRRRSLRQTGAWPVARDRPDRGLMASIGNRAAVLGRADANPRISLDSTLSGLDSFGPRFVPNRWMRPITHIATECILAIHLDSAALRSSIERSSREGSRRSLTATAVR